MNRTTRIAVASAILCAPLLMALPKQPQAPTQAFEVASIKPYKDDATAGGVVMIGGGCRGFDSPAPGAPGGPGGGGATTMVMMVGGPGGGGGAPPNPARIAGPAATPIGRCRFTRMTLKNLINSAYRITALGGSVDQMLMGGPAWVGTDTFDVEAKAEDSEHTSQDQLRGMLQTLLAERFNLKFHREKKEMAGFDLVVAKGGLKLKEAAADASGPRGGSMSMNMRGPGSPMTMSSQRSTISSIVAFLSGRLGRAVQDKTGLTGTYDFTLSWTPAEGEGGGLGGITMQLPPGFAPAGASEPGVSLFTALQEQMGLRLEASKVMLDVFVIDSAEKPANQ